MYGVVKKSAVYINMQDYNQGEKQIANTDWASNSGAERLS